MPENTMNRSGNGQPVRPQGNVPADPRIRMNGAGAANAAHRPVNPQPAGNSARPANPVNSVNRTPAGNPGNPAQTPNRVQAPISGQPPVRRTPIQNPAQSGAGNSSVHVASAANPQSVREVQNMPASAPVSAKKPPEPVRPVPTPQPVQRKFPEDGLMRTKTTDLAPAPSVKAASSVKKTEKAKKAEKKEREYAGSDEGGNTVVSVIKAVVYIIFVLIVSVFLSITVIAVANDIYAFVKSDEVVEVTIPEYATLEEVSEILYKNDIIKYPTIFKLFAVAEHDNGEFLAGTYSVTPMMNYATLLGEFKEKPVSGVARITIPEGYTTDEIINLMVANGIGTREGYEDVIQNYDFDYWFIDELEASGRTANRLYRLDGYLFPDTYEFYKNSSEATVIGKLLKRFSQIFTREYRDQCAALGYSVDQMITLASMIEKEAASPSEFFWVSSVFHNRLNNPWSFPKLESDATVLYIIAHDKGERPKTVTPEDLQYQTLYNTYMYEGLPPGPIANPSASALLAALSPVSSDYYYFYYMSSLGRTVYSATKPEHDAYIAQDKQGTQQTTGDVPEVTP